MSNLTKNLSRETGLNEFDVCKIMQTAPRRYKTFYILKRNNSGKRKISQPAREVKTLQRALVKIFLGNLPVHECSTAYKKGSSIRENALVHKNSGPILKIDFKDFFPSIKRTDWINYCKTTGCLTDPNDIELTASLLFQKQKTLAIPRLAIGAPSSPILSNILMYEFDCQISEALKFKRIKYTRYADDLTFSAPRTGYLHDVHKALSQTIRNINSPRLIINENKTNYATKKYNRTITGLVISNQERVTIGWRRKRLIHAAVHNALKSKLNNTSLRSLAGTLAFVNSSEPEFMEVLIKKYGLDIINKIKRTKLLI